MDEEDVALFCYRFRQALQADLEENQVAYQIQMIHEELNREAEDYKQVWSNLSSRERSAIKKYLEYPCLRLFMEQK